MDISAVNRGMPASVGSVSDVPVQKAQENRDIVQAVRAVNAAEMFGQDNLLTFQRDLQSRQMVLRVINQETQEVVLQLPSEQVLRMAEALKQQEADGPGSLQRPPASSAL